MNEQNPGTEPVETTSLTVPYKDRSTGLIVFGVLTIALGGLFGLLVPLMLAGQALAATTTHAPTSFSTILPAIFMYGGLAVVLVWLGIGSILARRWARALLLIFSWSWLVLGVFEVIAMAFIMPKVLANLSSTGTADHPAVSAAAMDMVLVVMFVMYGVLFIILPAVWTFFYNSRHVKATCEARDPATCWTDACPLPVLALCLWSLFSVLMMLVAPMTTHGVAPFFGMFLTGAPGMLFYLILAALWSYAAWLLYQLDPRGWWLILIALCVGMTSTLVTFAQHDLLEMYRLMDFPEAQIEQIQKTGLLEGHWMIWLMSFSMLPFLGYLLFIKRYFHRKS
ncbi:MAG: hypothetical protein LV481_01295 [Methylacidiphilales bacterium]|nr:hypothetical protein [Candidatus Methylacidiphilales bacterium]